MGLTILWLSLHIQPLLVKEVPYSADLDEDLTGKLGELLQEVVVRSQVMSVQGVKLKLTRVVPQVEQEVVSHLVRRLLVLKAIQLSRTQDGRLMPQEGMRVYDPLAFTRSLHRADV